VSPSAPASGEDALAATGLCCLRGERVLFSNLSIELAPGRVLQVEGPNGSGKTTLLRALCGLVPLEAGRIQWRGQDIEEDREAYHADLAYVGHLPGVKHDLSPAENLAVAAALGPRPAALAAGAIRDALDRLGLGGFVDTPLRRLSAGQCRRVALARLLVVPAPLWILDEPFTALDVDGRALVEHLLAGHCANEGSAIVATHHPLAADGFAVTHLAMGS
jgi:heme exporter protein A